MWGVSLTKSPPRTLPRRYVEQKALLWHNRLSCSVEPTFEVTSLDLNDSLEFHVREVASVAGGVNRGPRALEESGDVRDGEEAVVGDAVDERFWDQGLRQSGVSRRPAFRCIG